MQEVMADSAPEPVGPYPHARQVGDFLLLSGMGPRIPGEQEIPGVTLNDQRQIVNYCIETQTRQVFANLKAVLESAGAEWNDLVDITVFLTNMDDDFKTFNRVYAEYFTDNKPCRTTVEVNKLPTPIAVELKCLAYKPKEKSNA